MEIKANYESGILRLVLRGRLDTFGAVPAQKALDAYFLQHPRYICLDLTGVDFISSAGLRFLMIALKEASARQGRLVLAGLQPYCRAVIETIRVADAMVLCESAEEAQELCRHWLAAKQDDGAV